MKLRSAGIASLASLLSLMASGSQAAVQMSNEGVSGLATVVSESAQVNAVAPSDAGAQLVARAPLPIILVPQGFVGAAAAVTAVPEPAGWAMMLVGFAGLGVVLRRRRRTAAA
jgi:hypothetical protein